MSSFVQNEHVGWYGKPDCEYQCVSLPKKTFAAAHVTVSIVRSLVRMQAVDPRRTCYYYAFGTEYSALSQMIIDLR